MLSFARALQIKVPTARLILAILVLALIGLATPGAGQQPLIEEFVLDDPTQPVTAGQLDRAIARANSEGAAALLIQLNTPGGLVDSMRNMAGAILSSRVPVIIYVAPAGARAGSAGFFLLGGPHFPPWAPGRNGGA